MPLINFLQLFTCLDSYSILCHLVKIKTTVTPFLSSQESPGLTLTPMNLFDILQRICDGMIDLGLRIKSHNAFLLYHCWAWKSYCLLSRESILGFGFKYNNNSTFAPIIASINPRSHQLPGSCQRNSSETHWFWERLKGRNEALMKT